MSPIKKQQQQQQEKKTSKQQQKKSCYQVLSILNLKQKKYLLSTEIESYQLYKTTQSS